MWDDDFKSKKFELGRIIKRDDANELNKDFKKLNFNDKP
jgi:hypothetical protein